MVETTIAIYRSDLQTWKRWLKTKKMKSAEFINSLIAHVEAKRQAEFYLSLPMPDRHTKRLSDCKIDKCNKSIEKTGSSLR